MAKAQARPGGYAAIWALVLSCAGGCRDPARVGQERASEAGGETSTAANAAGAHAGHSNAEPGAGGEPSPAAPSERPGATPPRVACGGRKRPHACRVSGDSAAGVRLIGTLLEPRALRVDGVLDLDASGNIACVGCDCGDPGEKLVIDCPDVVVSPGLVNLHEHLGYAGTPPLAHPGELYEHRNDWRLGENGHAALPFEGGASAAEVLAQELRHVMSGTTSLVGAGGRRGLARNLELPDRGQGLMPGKIVAETFPLDDAHGEVDGASCTFGAHPDSAESAAAAQAYLAHLGEGTSQRAEDELRCALENLELIGGNAAVVHAMALTRSDAGRLAARGASVIWSPRSNLDLYGATAPVALLSSLGVHVALGTDWLASGSMSLLRELSCARDHDREVLGGYFGSFELWRMVTANAAWALGLEGRFAALSPGLVGDVAVFARREDDEYLSVVAAKPGDVRLVLRGGAPLYGDEELVSAFRGAEACEGLEVCEAPRLVCSAETGLSLAELREAGEPVYPLFSCDAPPNEPRCRALSDRECPFGETSCAPPAPPPAWDASDADADGVPDVEDDCPRDPDAEQRDRDADGRGDACDACPSYNPGLAPCPLRIAELRAPGARLATGTAVELRDVRVTAVHLESSKGFYVEDGDHEPYSGIFVYTGDTKPHVDPGDRVDLRGYFDAYRGTDELVAPELLARTAEAATYPPSTVELTALADGAPGADAYASMLVQISASEVADPNPDAPDDFDETLLAGGLRLDDWLVAELDNQYPASTRFASIRGIAGFSFGHHKLFPRSLADLVAE